MVNKHSLMKVESEEFQQCERCATLIKMSSDINKHWDTQYFRIRAERKASIISQNEIEDPNMWNIRTNGETLERVHKIKYLGKFVTRDSKDYIAAKENLKKIR